MPKYIRLILVILMLLSLLVLVPSGSNAEVRALGLNEKAPAPREECYTDWTYEDPSISVRVEQGRMFETNYLAAYVKIADPSQLRTAFALTFYAPDTVQGKYIARDENAILAINADYYSAPERLDMSYVCRQGVVYRLREPIYDWDYMWYLDVLIIDENGDFHIEKNATKERLKNLPYTPINGFTFGPALVINGEVQTDLKDMNNGAYKSTLRMCIAQTGHLEYLCVCCECSLDPGSKGMTLAEFAQLMGTFEGVQIAYNLDGGDSCQMFFHGEKINSPLRSQRDLADIIYFASAYFPD